MNHIKSTLIAIALLLSFTTSYSQTVNILFDATKAETAANADWVIDADLHNMTWSPGGSTSSGSESNAQNVPTPAQSGITATTVETFWKGALSSWGIDCVKRGYHVETLPYNGSITYGSSSNARDLSHYKIFIVCEPNIQFSAAEKTAILSFVQNGGSLFMISDHNLSDRNGDGWDSPAIWNDLMTGNPFGITFNLNDFSGVTTDVITTPDSVINGPMGTVTEAQWANGTDMTINTTINPTLKPIVFQSGYMHNNAKVMAVYGRHGSGKIAAMGDSSPFDDGTGDTGDVLYNGYWTDAAGNHQLLIMNITIWLAQFNTSVTTEVADISPNGKEIAVYPNPVDGETTIAFNRIISNATIKFINITGQIMKEEIVNNTESYTFSSVDLSSGIYFIEVNDGSTISRCKFIKAR
jgi:hypothetical protein